MQNTVRSFSFLPFLELICSIALGWVNIENREMDEGQREKTPGRYSSFWITLLYRKEREPSGPRSFHPLVLSVHYLPIIVLPAVRPDVIASSKPATVRPPVTSPAAYSPGIVLPSVPMTSALVLTFKPPLVM